MNPQSWLDAFVQRNLVDLARMRGYVEMSLATAMTAERKKRPRPESPQGAVVAMDVRDRTLLNAGNPLFESGTFRLKARPNRAVRLVEKDTGLELAVRKVAETVALRQYGDTTERWFPVQEGLFESPVDGLAEGLVPAVVWSIDKSDLLGEFRAVVVDGLESLNRSPLTVCASVEVPPLESVLAAASGSGSSSSVVGDDFGDMIRRKSREDSDEGSGGASSGA